MFAGAKWLTILGLFLLLGCPDEQVEPIEPSTPPGEPIQFGTKGPDAGNQNAPAPAVDAGAVANPDAGPGQPVDAGPGAPAYRLKFIALGDVGESEVGQPHAGQYAVASAMKQVCTQEGGCDFAVMLGDNIYDEGVEDAEDARWSAVFEDPYAELDFPFYATLGNHDYGSDPLSLTSGGAGLEPCRGEAQVAYAGVQTKFKMPGTFYQVFLENVELVSLNTTAMFWADFSFAENLSCSYLTNVWSFEDENEKQETQLPLWAQSSTADWRIAFGHHPYLSNGRHGNAGAYELGFEWSLPGSGTELKSFFENYIQGHFDLYLAGHDHSVQDMGEVGGTQWIVSGAGAKASEVEARNDAPFYVAELGFVLFDVTPSQMKMTFIIVTENASGPATWQVRHTRVVNR